VKHVFRKPGVLLLLLGGPLLMDFTIALVALYVNLRTVDLGVPPRFQCLLAVAWSLGYVIGAHCTGRWCTARRAVPMMVSSLLGSAVVGCVLFLAEPSFAFFLSVNGVFGALAGFYFGPFQVKMGHIHPFHSMATAVAVYNMSWGAGLALGGAGCGWIMEQPGAKWIACGTVVAIAAAQLLSLFTSRTGREGKERTSEEMTSTFSSTLLQRRCGWIAGFVAFLMSMGLNATLWPNLGRETGRSSFQIGLGLFLMMAQLPLLSLAWARVRERLRKPVILVCLLLLLGLAFLVLPLVHHWAWQYVTLVVIGIAFTGITFHAVYYSNADPTSRARSVGINETVVGIAALLGPLTMGWLAWDTGLALRPYLAGCALAILAATVITISWLRDDLNTQV